MQEKRSEFRNALLPATLQHAASHVGGYRELWSVTAETPPEASDFQRLPLTTKEIFAKDPDLFRDISVATAVLQHTGGTTQQPLIMQRGEAEISYIRNFFSEVIAGISSPQKTPLCIVVLGNFHGDPTPMPYPGPTFNLDLNDGYWDIHNLISNPSKFMGIPIESSIVVGLESQLRILTCKLIESEFNFAKSTVTSIHSTGDLLTERLREFYESTWRCSMTSRYSMSEVFGGAELCSICGYYHCDTHIIGEILDPVTEKPVKSGIGILVLTSLFPFVQKQPIIRYRTGDIVLRGPSDCSVDKLAFSLKGREMHSILETTDAGTSAFLFGSEVYDILDNIPDVAQSEFMEVFKSLKGISNHIDLGHLKYSVDFDRTSTPQVLSLTVEFRYTPYLYAKSTAEVLEKIRVEVLIRHPYLKDQVETGNVNFLVQPAIPGSLVQVQVDETE